MLCVYVWEREKNESEKEENKNYNFLTAFFQYQNQNLWINIETVEVFKSTWINIIKLMNYKTGMD